MPCPWDPALHPVPDGAPCAVSAEVPASGVPGDRVPPASVTVAGVPEKIPPG